MEKIVDMTDALKQVRDYKKEPEQEKMVITNADKSLNNKAYQNYKSGDNRYTPAEDLEEQKRQLEEEIKCLSEEMDSMIQEKRQEGFAVRYSLDGQRKVQAYKTEKDAEHRAEILKSMGGVKDVSITKHTLNFKEKNINEARYMVIHDYGSRFGSSAYELSVVVSASSPHDAMKKGEDKLEKLAGTPKAEKLGIDELQDPNAKPEIKITDKPLSYTNMKKF